jgi:hypothetical protein
VWESISLAGLPFLAGPATPTDRGARDSVSHFRTMSRSYGSGNQFAIAMSCLAGLISKHRRKGEAQEPYVEHLAGVAELVATATEGRDANLVAAAVLRDTVEDTATLLGELASIFVGYLADGDIGVVVGHWKTRNVAHAGRVAMET